MIGNLSCNGAPIVGGTIRMPLVGLWHADLHAQSTTAITGKVMIATADSAFSLVGTVLPGTDVDDDSVRIRIVGGVGGMGKTLAPKNYVGVAARLPMQDVLSAAGEKLSSASDSASLGKFLGRWQRVGTTAANALLALTESIGANYRGADDGTIWIGVDTFPTVTIKADILKLSPASGTMVIGGDQPSLHPGTTYQGKRVIYVEHTIGSGSLTTTLWYDRNS